MADSKEVNPFTGKNMASMPTVSRGLAKHLQRQDAKKRSQADSSSGMVDIEEEADPSASQPQKFIILAGWTSKTSVTGRRSEVWLLVAVPDGRLCKACGESDESSDPLVATEFRAWFYPPVPGKNGDPPRNAGKICFYCGRLHNIRYCVTFKDTKSWVLTLAPGSQAMKLFKERLDNLIKLGACQ